MRMNTRISIGLAVVFLLLIVGSVIKVARSSQPSPQAVATGLAVKHGLAMPGDHPEAIVEFQIVEMKPARREGVSMRVWDATYPSISGTAHFEIAIELRDPMHGEQFASTRGVLTAREDSRPEALLSALARAHSASRSLRAIGAPSKTRAREVELVTSILGMGVTRGPGSYVLAGEFTTDKPGPWIVVKLFLPAEDAEIYVALDPSAGKGLFMTRDEECWPDLEPLLESVL